MNSIRTIGLSRSLLASRAFAGAGAGARVAAVRPLAVAPLMARGLSSQAPAKKPIAIQELSETAELEQLDGQRNRRPTSPHLDIYQPQLTWVMSGLHRATGCAAVGFLYGYSIIYGFSPLFGVQEYVSPAELVSIASSLPVWLKTVVKAPLAAVVSFHAFNGLRHLIWDTGRALTLPGVYKTGYAVIGAAALSTIALLFV